MVAVIFHEGRGTGMHMELCSELGTMLDIDVFTTLFQLKSLLQK